MVVGAESMAVLYAVGAVVRRARAIGPSLSENSLAWLTDVGTSFAAQESALSTSSAEPLRSNWPVRSAARNGVGRLWFWGWLRKSRFVRGMCAVRSARRAWANTTSLAR